jgi:hypothetical protein
MLIEWKDNELDELLIKAEETLTMTVQRTKEKARILLIDAPYQREVRMEMDTQYNLQVQIVPFGVIPNAS